MNGSHVGQRLSSDGTNSYGYDFNGNTLTKSGAPGNFTFGWDGRDRMTSISGAATATYGYDYQGRRRFKSVSGSRTDFLYDGLNLVGETGASTANYVFGPGIDEPLAMSRGGSVYYPAVDALGSVALVTDASGAVQDSYSFDAWGQIKAQTGALVNPFGYAGRETGEAGFDFNRARYYSPGLGSFDSEDPVLALVQAYTYGHNNPIQFTDPLGLYVYSVSQDIAYVNGAVGSSTGFGIGHVTFTCKCMTASVWQLLFRFQGNIDWRFPSPRNAVVEAHELGHLQIYEQYVKQYMKLVEPAESVPYATQAECESAGTRNYRIVVNALDDHVLTLKAEECAHDGAGCLVRAGRYAQYSFLFE